MSGKIRHVNPRFFSTARPKLVYIPWKTKEEILALHEEDATRWNVSTLSTRFNAPRENVEALLRLGELRKSRENTLQSLESEERERIMKARDRAIKEWNKLIESIPTVSIRASARPSELKRPAADVDEEANTEDEEQKANAAPTQQRAALEEGEGMEVLEEKKSPWAEYLETEVDNFEPDVKRETTYAFVEVGDDKDGMQRAVWLRESNGKIRMANSAERKLLLNEERARDSTAWQS